MRSKAPESPIVRGHVPRTCRRCGCTEAEACELRHGVLTHVNGVELPEPGLAVLTCHWVDRDLCSRCLRPGELTGAQRHEIARISSRFGRVGIQRSFNRGRTVFVELLAWGSSFPTWRPGPTLELDAGGRCLGVTNPQPHPIAPRGRALDRLAAQR